MLKFGNKLIFTYAVLWQDPRDVGSAAQHSPRFGTFANFELENRTILKHSFATTPKLEEPCSGPLTLSEAFCNVPYVKVSGKHPPSFSLDVILGIVSLLSSFKSLKGLWELYAN